MIPNFPLAIGQSILSKLTRPELESLAENSRMKLRSLASPLAAVLAFAFLCSVSAQAPAGGRRIAITIDDGPVVGELKDLARFQQISAGLLGSLQAEKVPATIFINERQINVQGQRDGRAAVLANWLDAGYDLGNHTYSHPSVNEVPLWQFEDNLVKGEVIIRSLMEEHGRKLVWFRFPFLDCGKTPEV